MKNNKRIIYPIIFGIFITIIFCVPYYQPLIDKGHDLSYHLSRIDGIKDAFLDLQILPKIYPYKNFLFGYASPLFYCDLFIYIPTLFYMCGLSLIDTYILIIMIFTFFSTLSMYYCAYKIFDNVKMGYLSSILYIFSYYRIIDVFDRAALGEVAAFIFIPLAILAMYELFVNKKDVYLLLGIAFSGLLLSHNITFALYVILFGIFIIFYYKDFFSNKNIIYTIVKGVFLAIGLSSMFLFPMLEQLLSNTFRVNHMSEYLGIEYSAISTKMLFAGQYFNYNIHLDSFIRRITILIVFLILFIPILYIFNRKRLNKFFKVCLLISWICMIVNLDIIPWEKLSIFLFMQFTWRLLIISVPLVTIIFSFWLYNMKNKLLIMLCCIIVFISTLNQYSNIVEIDVVGMPHNMEYGELVHTKKYGSPVLSFFDFVSAECGSGEYIPYSDLIMKKHSLNITYNDLTDAYSDFYRDGTTMVFELNEKEKNVDILFPISWYKGYQVYRIDENNNKLENMHAVKDENYALVKFNTGQYTTGKFMMVYENTLVQNISYLISLFTFIWLINKLKIICLKKSSQFK